MGDGLPLAQSSSQAKPWTARSQLPLSPMQPAARRASGENCPAIHVQRRQQAATHLQRQQAARSPRSLRLGIGIGDLDRTLRAHQILPTANVRIDSGLFRFVIAVFCANRNTISNEPFKAKRKNALRVFESQLSWI